MSSGKKILIIDDDSELRKSLGEQLQLHEEFETGEAETGASALEAVKNDYFDAILLDAPCSASGVIRRHPDIKLLRRESDSGKGAAR